MKKYRQNPNEPWLFLDQDERDKCCNEEEPGAAVQPQDCVEDWKQKLSDAREAMETAAAKYDKANKSYTNAAAWKAKLEKWKEDAEDAHEKAVDVYLELDRFIDAVDRTRTADTSRAVKAVLCLVKSIFDDVNDMVRVSSSVEEPKGGIQELKQWIECDESLDAIKKEKALSCILPFEDQMKVVNGAQEDLLNKLLEILLSTNVLVAVVDKSGTKENAGLTWQLTDLQNRISGKTAYTARERKCGGGDTEPSFDPPCEIDIINPPTPYLPIRKMEGVSGSADSTYYSNIVDLFNQAEAKEEENKNILADAEAQRDDAVAYYNGLNDAIKAAEAAKPAK